MTWTNRFRLFGGLLAVLALVAVLTIVFNHRQTLLKTCSGVILRGRVRQLPLEPFRTGAMFRAPIHLVE